MFFITCDYGDKVETAAETESNWTFEQVCVDILSGEIEKVKRVLEFDLKTGLGIDVTKKVARTLADQSHRDGVEPHYEVCAFIESAGFEPYRTPRTRREIIWDTNADRLADLAA